MSDYLEYSLPGDDYQVPDLVPFSVANVGTTSTDVTFEGGTTVCTCPDNYVMIAQAVSFVNVTGSAIKGTLQIVSGATTVVLLEVELAANTSTLIASTAAFRVIAWPTFKFQALSSAATSLDIQMLVRLIFGAGL